MTGRVELPSFAARFFTNLLVMFEKGRGFESRRLTGLADARNL